jgi:hypothetical protein
LEPVPLLVQLQVCSSDPAGDFQYALSPVLFQMYQPEPQ